MKIWQYTILIIFWVLEIYLIIQLININTLPIMNIIYFSVLICSFCIIFLLLIPTIEKIRGLI